MKRSKERKQMSPPIRSNLFDDVEPAVNANTGGENNTVNRAVDLLHANTIGKNHNVNCAVDLVYAITES
jgi:hypothetical protein